MKNVERAMTNAAHNRPDKSGKPTHTPIAFALLLIVAMFMAGCGGGGSSSSGGGSNPPPNPPPPSADTILLKADAGGVCETLLNGEAYTRAPPTLSCNGGADPYTAYLDGSKSSSSTGDPLSYAWSFVSKPAGSTVQLSGADTAKPTFVPDMAGPYAVQLVVTAGGEIEPSCGGSGGRARRRHDQSELGRQYLRGARTTSTADSPASAVSVTRAQRTRRCRVSRARILRRAIVCQTCHSPEGFTVVGFVDHTEVFGVCSDCHNGMTATGKSANHLVTTQECSDCHTTTVSSC